MPVSVHVAVPDDRSGDRQDSNFTRSGKLCKDGTHPNDAIFVTVGTPVALTTNTRHSMGEIFGVLPLLIQHPDQLTANGCVSPLKYRRMVVEVVAQVGRTPKYGRLPPRS